MGNEILDNNLATSTVCMPAIQDPVALEIHWAVSLLGTTLD